MGNVSNGRERLLNMKTIRLKLNRQPSFNKSHDDGFTKFNTIKEETRPEQPQTATFINLFIHGEQRLMEGPRSEVGE